MHDYYILYLPPLPTTRTTQAVAPVLDNPAEPVSDLSYFDCLDLVMERSQVVGEAGAKITFTAKKQNYDQFGEAVDLTAKAVCQLTMSAAQAAYLVGIADPSSIAATPGLVDQTQFARASQAISMACQNLLSPNSTQQQVKKMFLFLFCLYMYTYMYDIVFLIFGGDFYMYIVVCV